MINIDVNDFINYVKELEEKRERKISRICRLSSKDRDLIIQKIKRKYESDEYKSRYLSRGKEPREYLYSVLLEYGRWHGEINTTAEEYEVFPCESFIIDGKWIITCVYGQGCFYRLTLKREGF